MRSRVKFLGHALHPMLVVFPLGLLIVAVIFDGIGLATQNGFWATLAFYLIAAGLLSGVLAALAGWLDWLTIPQNTRAQTVGLIHGGLNIMVLILFLASWLLRRFDPPAPSRLALGLSFAGAGLALLGSWLGGELVSRLGVGVDDGAHLDAPNSLSGQPANNRRQTIK